MFTSKAFKTEIKIAVAAIALLVGFGAAQANAFAAPDVLQGIALDVSLSAQDTAYLETSLQILYSNAPDWYDFVEQAKPFRVSVDAAQGALGRAAIATCCDAQGFGTIVLGYHPGESPDADTPEAQMVLFIGTFVHEVTHVSDIRTGRYAPKTDFQSCVAVEKSGLYSQLQVKRALADADLGSAYRGALDEQVAQEGAAIGSRALWDFYCGAFEETAD